MAVVQGGMSLLQGAIRQQAWEKVKLACRQLQDKAEGAIIDLYFSQRHGFILLVCLVEYESEWTFWKF